MLSGRIKPDDKFGIERTKELLSEMVRIDSRYPNEKEIGIFLKNLFEGMGFDVLAHEFEPNRYNIFATKGSKPDTLFLGHMDTVQIEGEKWVTDPFTLTKDGDRLYGLGAWDMKGGIAAIAEAVNSPDLRKGGVSVLICSDEENISKGMWSMMKDHPEAINRAGLVISAEPPIYGNKPTDGIELVTVGRMGRGLISVEIKARSVHASRQENGSNALEIAFAAAAAVRRMPKMTHELFGKEVIYTKDIVSTAASAFSAPNSAKIIFDVISAQELEDVKERIRAALSVPQFMRDGVRVSVGIEPRETPYLRSYVTDLENARVLDTLKIIARDYRPPKIKYAASISDENIVGQKKPTIRIGPAGGNAHGSGEYVLESSLAEAMQFYSTVARGGDRVIDLTR